MDQIFTGRSVRDVNEEEIENELRGLIKNMAGNKIGHNALFGRVKSQLKIKNPNLPVQEFQFQHALNTLQDEKLLHISGQQSSRTVHIHQV